MIRAQRQNRIAWFPWHRLLTEPIKVIAISLADEGIDGTTINGQCVINARRDEETRAVAVLHERIHQLAYEETGEQDAYPHGFVRMIAEKLKGYVYELNT